MICITKTSKDLSLNQKLFPLLDVWSRASHLIIIISYWSPILTCFILFNSPCQMLWGKYFNYPHFTDEETGSEKWSDFSRSNWGVIGTPPPKARGFDHHALSMSIKKVFLFVCVWNRSHDNESLGIFTRMKRQYYRKGTTVVIVIAVHSLRLPDSSSGECFHFWSFLCPPNSISTLSYWLFPIYLRHSFFSIVVCPIVLIRMPINFYNFSNCVIISLAPAFSHAYWSILLTLSD